MLFLPTTRISSYCQNALIQSGAPLFHNENRGRVSVAHRVMLALFGIYLFTVASSLPFGGTEHDEEGRLYFAPHTVCAGNRQKYFLGMDIGDRNALCWNGRMVFHSFHSDFIFDICRQKAGK